MVSEHVQCPGTTHGIDVAGGEGAKLEVAPMLGWHGHRHSDFITVVIARIPEIMRRGHSVISN